MWTWYGYNSALYFDSKNAGGLMEVVKKTDTYVIVKKRSGRFGVKNQAGKWINGDEKVKILVEAGLVKVTVSKEEPVEESDSSENSAEETTESAPSTDTTTEEAPAEA
jgi:hypothetical protein